MNGFTIIHILDDSFFMDKNGSTDVVIIPSALRNEIYEKFHYLHHVSKAINVEDINSLFSYFQEYYSWLSLYEIHKLLKNKIHWGFDNLDLITSF